MESFKKVGTIKKVSKIFLLVGVLLLAIGGTSHAYLTGKAVHEKCIYPVVRVNDGGSGTIIYSKLNEDGKYSTYLLTNHHVIQGAITVTEKWDSDLQKDIKKEKRKIIYVEIFQYSNLSTPIGTLKVEAEILAYSADEDLAIVKLRMETKARYVAEMMDKGGMKKIYCGDETIAVGCSLGFPPIMTHGNLTRKNFQIDSLPYHMSTAQIIFGNSGGAMFTGDGKWIGIPSLVPVYGWSIAASHMGLFITLDRVHEWLGKEHFEFLYDGNKTEKECMEKRKAEIESKKKGEMK